MLSTPRAMEAGHAADYFKKEDYYLRGAEQGRNSQWCGKGARAQRLKGEVLEEDFRALCRGEDPAGNRLVDPKVTHDKVTDERVETHREGNDYTYSDPKSDFGGAAGVGSAGEAAPFGRHQADAGYFCRGPAAPSAGTRRARSGGLCPPDRHPPAEGVLAPWRSPGA